MKLIKPSRSILSLWRTVLVLCALIPAFLNSVFFSFGSTVWIVITCVWVAAFLFFYIFYFPRRYAKMQFALTETQIVLHSGVFYRRIRAIPLRSIQFAGLITTPLGSLWKLTTLSVTAAGGRLMIPGLRKNEAKALLSLLSPDDIGL